eukprot:jgi/Mesvir1/15279/Mv06497-RA.1
MQHMQQQEEEYRPRPKAVNRAAITHLKHLGAQHKTGLTPSLLQLFAPRPPLEYIPPTRKRKLGPYSGIAQYTGEFCQYGDPEYCPPVTRGETPAERKARIHAIKLERGADQLREGIEKYNPQEDPNAQGDPYKTLFVSRISYETTEQRLKREFEAYGPIKRIRLVNNVRTDQPRGYAFIEYQHSRDMKTAYKQGDGRKIDGRRVLVDVERGRTVPNWRPRRLGGDILRWCGLGCLGCLAYASTLGLNGAGMPAGHHYFRLIGVIISPLCLPLEERRY